MDGAWTEAGHRWEGQSTHLRLDGWSRQRRVVLLRRKLRALRRPANPDQSGQHLLSFATVDARKQVWEYGALVTSLNAEILTRPGLFVTGPTARTTSTNSRTSGLGGLHNTGRKALSVDGACRGTGGQLVDTCSCGSPIRTIIVRRSPAGHCC